MAQSVEIQNYRCFEAATLPDCRRINLIVGENGSGKTALMEALFLATGMSATVVLRMRAWRGFADSVSGLARSIDRAVWGDLFHNYNFKKPVSVSLQGSRLHTREVRISYHERNITIPMSKMSKDAGWRPVTFTWIGPNKRVLHTETPTFSEGKIEIPLGPEGQLDSAFFPANQTYSSKETAGRFSDLSKLSNENELIEHFKSQFHAIEGLSLQLHAGEAMLFAKLKSQDEQIPLTLVSGGMNKLASILFAIPATRYGIIFIDEVENGFYYRRLPEIWNSIWHFAKAYDVQIFATTHSAECLQAAAGVAEKNTDEFSVIHVANQSGKGRVRQFSGDNFISAMEENIEIR